MNIRKTINLPIFRGKMLVVFTDQMAKVAGMYSDEDDPMAKYEAVTIDMDGNPIIIFNLELSVSTLVHEVTHAVDNLLSHRGIHLVQGSEETYAYTMGYVTQLITDFIAKTPAITLQ